MHCYISRQKFSTEVPTAQRRSQTSPITVIPQWTKQQSSKAEFHVLLLIACSAQKLPLTIRCLRDILRVALNHGPIEAHEESCTTCFQVALPSVFFAKCRCRKFRWPTCHSLCGGFTLHSSQRAYTLSQPKKWTGHLALCGKGGPNPGRMNARGGSPF